MLPQKAQLSKNMTSKSWIVLFARMSSSRLPGKTLLKLGSRSLLEICCQRLQGNDFNFIVATSDHASDHSIQTECERLKIECFRGSLESPSQRLFSLIEEKSIEKVVRATADNILPDHQLAKALEHVAKMYPKDCYSCVFGGNGMYPKGFALEYFSTQFLEKQAKLGLIDDEHLTGLLRKKYVDRMPRISNISPSQYNFSIDTPEDYEQIKDIWEDELIVLSAVDLMNELAIRLEPNCHEKVEK